MTASLRWVAWFRSSICTLAKSYYGGVGTGLAGMIVMAILTVFHRGANGRTHAGVPGQEDTG